MALSGTITGSYSNTWYRVEIDWSATQNVSGNYSTVTANVYITYYSLYIGSRTGTCTINGTAQSFSVAAISHNAGGRYRRKVGTVSQKVNHNSDGTKSITISASFPFKMTSPEIGTLSASGTITLDTIPRATTPTVSGTLALGNSITISTASRASSSFTHNLSYSWGTQVTDVSIATGVTTSATWTIPKTLAEYIQAGTSGTMYLKCVTYNGSTAIGTKTLTLTITVPDTAEFRPTIQSVTISEANDLPIGVYVQGKSALKVTVAAVGAYVSGSANRNSYPASATVVVDGVTYSKTLGQNAAASWYITSGTISQTGSRSVSVTVKDSRGRTATKTARYTAYEYNPPVINSFTVKRCDADGTANDSGVYALFTLSAVVASCNNLNAKQYRIVYESGGSETTLASGTLSAYTATLSYNSNTAGVSFSVDNSYTVRAYVLDSFNASTPAVSSAMIPTEATFMDWRSNGKGFAFGKVSTKDGFECGWQMYDRFDTNIGNGLVGYTGSGDSAIDPDTTIEHQILTNKNTPTGAFWYVVTMFYSTKSDSSNRVQFAYPYSAVNSVYFRYYYNQTWSEWVENPAVYEAGASGIWNYRKMTNGEAELWGTYAVSDLECTTAFGGWYRTAIFTPPAFPFTVTNPKLIANYDSDGYGALLWATTTATNSTPSSYYLIRPTSATIASGNINMRVKGRWK